MGRKMGRPGLLELALAVASVLYFGGLLLVFGPCEAKEDGSWMSCHWAGNALLGVTGVMVLLALLHLLFRSPERKQGVDLSIVLLSLLSALLPGGLIHLCMMAQMRCRQLTRPAALAFGIFLCLLALTDFVWQGRAIKMERKGAGHDG